MTFLPDPAATAEVTPESVATWLELPQEDRPVLVDCREEEELAICQLPGNVWAPLSGFPDHLERLKADSGRGIVIYCHHGMRSMRAALFLRSKGLENTFSMQGGINLWSQRIDPSVPVY